MKNVKNLLIACSIATSFTLSAKAENETYQKAMQNALEQYDSVKTMDDYQAIANAFERIAAMEEKEWLPRYYSALTYVYMSFNGKLEKKERDNYLDRAQSFADRAEELSENNVEIMVLNGYITMAKLSINPAIRGMMLTPKAMGFFEKARQMDPQNPRAALLLARMKYGTAQFFKSSTEESCQIAHEGKELLENEGDRGIEPHWGWSIANSLTKVCSQN